MGKKSDCNAGDWDSIPGSGRPSGGGNDNLFPYSCLENRATVHQVSKSWT